jgi:hypothetical protein
LIAGNAADGNASSTQSVWDVGCGRLIIIVRVLSIVADAFACNVVQVQVQVQVQFRFLLLLL